MTIQNRFFRQTFFAATLFSLFLLANCKNDDATERNLIPKGAVLLLIDEESIDNGNQPNDYSETDVNDHIADVGLRDHLAYFKKNTGDTVVLYTGDVGDEGWFALKTIPASWMSAGPTAFGAQNFLAAGPGLGNGEDLLDKVPNVTPLRATGLKMLIGQTVLAVVYDSDISINYSPLTGNLKGANLGLVALEVLDVQERTDGSSASLPMVTLVIRDIAVTLAEPLFLFANAPVPASSSEPFDVAPPAVVLPIELAPAP
jgi:hypothetical protein